MVDECSGVHALIALDAIGSEEQVADDVQTHIALTKRVCQRHILVIIGSGIETIVLREVGSIPIVTVTRAVIEDFADFLQRFLPCRVARNECHVSGVLVADLRMRSIQQRVAMLVNRVDVNHLTVFVHGAGNGSLLVELTDVDGRILNIRVDVAELCVVAQVIVDVVRERRCAFEQVERTVACVDGCTFFGYGIENAIAVFRILAVHELELLHSGYPLVVEASDVVGGKLIPN